MSTTPRRYLALADDKGTALGVGYFNPKSLIAIRLLAPPGVKLGREFLAARLRRAGAVLVASCGAEGNCPVFDPDVAVQAGDRLFYVARTRIAA